MKRCEDYDALIEGLLADELADHERDRLLGHAQTCAGCREFVDLHHGLLATGAEVELPTEGEFAVARQTVLARIREAGVSRPGLLERLRVRFPRPVPAWATAALMLVLLAGGWMIGRATVEPAAVTVIEGPLLDLYQQAENHKSLADVEESPYVYTNVELGQESGGKLTLSFDVTRHMELTRSKDDSLVREILVQSLLNPSPVGTRLQAVAHTEGMIDPKVKQALMVTALNDPNQAVRLRALEILGQASDDEEVQSVLLAVLRGEESVQMRLRAMDYLGDSNVNPQRFSDALDELDGTRDQALFVRAARYETR